MLTNKKDLFQYLDQSEASIEYSQKQFNDWRISYRIEIGWGGLIVSMTENNDCLVKITLPSKEVIKIKHFMGFGTFATV